jgi:hypothetical protein
MHHHHRDPEEQRNKKSMVSQAAAYRTVTMISFDGGLTPHAFLARTRA